MTSFHFRSASAPSAPNEVLVPVHLTSKAELFTFLSHALPLPAYFGHNWDALEECLGDLPRPHVTLAHQDIPLANLPAEQRLYLQILARAASESDRLKVIFPETFRAQITALLATPKGA